MCQLRDSSCINFTFKILVLFFIEEWNRVAALYYVYKNILFLNSCEDIVYII